MVKNDKPQLADYMEFKSVSFVNVGLPEALNKRLNKYVLAKAQEAGKVSYGLKTAIMRMALLEWLEKHEKDLSL